MPSSASSAANNPLRAACPTWNGLVIVPKLALMPEAIEAASASAVAILSGDSRSRCAQAAAAPKAAGPDGGGLSRGGREAPPDGFENALLGRGDRLARQRLERDLTDPIRKRAQQHVLSLFCGTQDCRQHCPPCLGFARNVRPFRHQ